MSNMVLLLTDRHKSPDQLETEFFLRFLEVVKEMFVEAQKKARSVQTS